MAKRGGQSLPGILRDHQAQDGLAFELAGGGLFLENPFQIRCGATPYLEFGLGILEGADGRGQLVAPGRFSLLRSLQQQSSRAGLLQIDQGYTFLGQGRGGGARHFEHLCIHGSDVDRHQKAPGNKLQPDDIQMMNQATRFMVRANIAQQTIRAREKNQSSFPRASPDRPVSQDWTGAGQECYQSAMQNISLTRRQFLHSSTLAVAAIGLKASGWAQTGKRKLPASLQLYSIRDDCAKDFDAALAQVAKMGFDGVEFAGYHKYSGKAKQLREKLDELNLKVAATHIGTGSFRGDALQQTIDFHQTIGCKFLIVPGDRDFTHPERSKALAETFNKTAEVLKPLSLACGYHNHTGEFKKDGDKTYWDLFAERTNKDVILQQDCGWTAAAGLDPVAMMKRYPGRMRSTHFKPTVVGHDQAKKAYLGQDSVDWAAVLAACLEFGGTEWVTLEQEAYPEGKSPMECTAISFEALKKLLAA